MGKGGGGIAQKHRKNAGTLAFAGVRSIIMAGIVNEITI
jgi:hypothetical protein